MPARPAQVKNLTGSGPRVAEKTFEMRKKNQVWE